MVSKSENLKKKILFFFFAKKKTIFLVFQYKDDAIRPELSSPARSRFQGGPLSVTKDKGQTNKQM